MMICDGKPGQCSPAASRILGRRKRRGSLLAEGAISGVLLIVAMSLTLRVLGWVGAERRSWDRRQWAMQEISNVMEELSSRPFESVTAESLTHLALSPQARTWLPGAELEAKVEENHSTGGPGSKRLAIGLRWRNQAGEWDSPVRLVSWIYRARPQQ
jgi:hypothetical protein